MIILTRAAIFVKQDKLSTFTYRKYFTFAENKLTSLKFLRKSIFCSIEIVYHRIINNFRVKNPKHVRKHQNLNNQIKILQCDAFVTYIIKHCFSII